MQLLQVLFYLLLKKVKLLDNIRRFASKKPQIKVYYNENIKNIEYIKEILLGIEEEGIPYQVEDKQFGNCT